MCTSAVPTKMDVNIDGYTYNEKDILGKGTFGSVFRGKDRNGKKIAIKKVSLPEEEFRDEDEFMKNIERERIALEKIVHPNVVKLYHVKKEEDFIFFIIEFCDCDLDSYFKNATSVSLKLRLQMMYEMALAVQYMHNMKPEPYVHRDIKPQNILLIIMGNKVVVKVADLGLARQMEYGESKVNATACFTPYYEAPEMWPNKEGKVQYYIGVDVFALGVLYQAILQTSPGQKLKPIKGVGTLSLGQWMSMRTMLGESVQPDVIIRASGNRMNQPLSDLIQKMLHQNPKQRIKSGAVVAELRIIRGIHINEGRGVLLTHNEADFTLHSKPLVEPHDVYMEKVEGEVTYTTVCLDNALTLPFHDQAQKLFSTACIKSKDCPLSLSSLGITCIRDKNLGRAIIKRASRILDKSKISSYIPRLSQEAILEIRSIEKVAEKYYCPCNDIKHFFDTFGSHFIHGSVATVSSFEWAVIAESNCNAEILREITEEVFQTCQRQPHVFEGSNSGVWYDISSFLDTVDWNKHKRKVLRLCKLRVMHNNGMEQKKTFQEWLQVTPHQSSDEIPCMLKSPEFVKPVWALIDEHSGEFQSPQSLAKLFQATWKNHVEGTKHLEKQATPIPVQIESTSDVVVLETKWKNLQKDIGIEKYCPNKLSLQEVMALDCCSSKPSSWNEIAWDMLKRLIMIDNRFLEKPFLDYIDEFQHQGDTHQKIVYPHPMDVMLLLFHASDFMLRQVLAKKLFKCRKAIPFIIPTENGQLQILLWPLRSIVLEWNKSDKPMEESIVTYPKTQKKADEAMEESLDEPREESLDAPREESLDEPMEESLNEPMEESLHEPMEVSLVTYPITRISFLKFGTSVFSKSNLINDVLSANRHRVFMTRESRLVGAKRIISNGMVEMTHYSPAGKDDDVFSEPLMLFNLRGDANLFTYQAEILAEHSHIVVFIYDVAKIRSKKVLEKLQSKRVGRIIVLLTNVTSLDGKTLDTILDETEDFIQDEKMEHVKMVQCFSDEGLNMNPMEIVHELRKAINAALPKSQICSLDKAVQQGSHRVIIDEISNKDCMKGRKLSQKLVDKMTKVPQECVKETLLPLQGNICKEMGSFLRRQYRERNHEEKENVNLRIKTLRRTQYSKFKLEQSFIAKYLLQPQIDGNTRLFFTKWVQLALDNQCRLHLPRFQKDYHDKWDILMKTKKTKTADPSQITKAQEECKSAEEKVAAVGLGLEHLMREISQIFEVTEDCKEMKELLRIAGFLFMAGYPLEIMDGDNGFIPMKWVVEVLNEVSSIVGTDKKVFVLSVLGVQSSGKSTLLNSMFGLEFAVSAGRCTRGIYAQMVPVNKQKRVPQLPFDYLLVLDSEGLGAPELAHKNNEHDNELATLVIGLADLTLINLNRESLNEIQDVLQIAVHAFLRMQIADYSTLRHCMFIHQNVSVLNAEVKMKYGQQKLHERLDEMTMQAAEALGWGKKFTLFNDVISFDGDKDTLYFPDLWNGDPPMATVNTNYSEMCVLVHKRILALNTNKQCKCITINDFVTRLKDMWKGVLAENFVFSFRNSLAAKAYTSLEQQCAKQRRLIESTLLGWINRECHIQIKNCSTEKELHDCYKYLSTEGLEAQNIGKYADQLVTFIENHPLKDILEQWKDTKLLTFQSNVEFDKSYLKEVLVEMRDRKRVILAQQAQQQNHEQEIMKKAIEYAENMREENRLDSDIETTFDDMWNMPSEIITLKDVKKGPKISSILYEILKEKFSHAESMYLSEEIKKHEPSTGILEIPTLTKDDFVITNFGHSSSAQLRKDIMIADECNAIIKKIISTTKQIVDDIVKQGSKFNRSHGNKVFQSIFNQLDELNSHENERAKVTFKPSAKAKVCLVFWDYAAVQFEKMNEEFERLRGVNAKVEAYRQKVFILFKDTVKQRLSEANAADYLCEAISPNIEEIVYKDMSRKVVDLILQDIGHVKFHLMLRIMQSFAETENFTPIMQYVTAAHTFASLWIKQHTNSNLLFESGKRQTKYVEFTASHVKKIIDCIREGAAEASKENVIDLTGWINSFCEHATHEVSITQQELKDLENYKITNFQIFGRLLENRLSDLNIKIKEKLAEVTGDSVIWNGPNPYVVALNKLWGCNEQCPFCGEPCQRADDDHEANHVCVQHRPNGINGVGHKQTKVLDVETCSMNVASDRFVTYRKITGNKNMHPFKDYQKFYPKWDIAPDDAGDAAQYWKWIFCKFEKQIQEWYSDHKLVIPESWHSITKKQALDSLRVYNP